MIGEIWTYKATKPSDNFHGSCSWLNFSKYDEKYLEKLSHEQEPWKLSREGLDPDERSDKTISKESIANYFINEVFQPEEEEWD